MRTTAVQKSNKKNYMMHKLIKSDSKDIYIVAKYFDLKCKCWSFYLSKDPEMTMVSTKIWSSTTVFNINNNKKYFLSTKSAY